MVGGFVYLTPDEQEVCDVLPSGELISSLEVNRVFGKRFPRTRVSSLLSRLVDKGKLVKARNGAYYVGRKTDAFFDYKFGLALAGRDAYLAFASALSFHHLITEKPGTVFVACFNKSRAREFGGRNYRVIALGRKCIGFKTINGVAVSTIPKTLFDCFLHPGFCGGLTGVVEALESSKLSAADWMEFEGYLNDFASNALKQRVGFIVDSMQGELKPPAAFLKRLKKSVSDSRTVCILEPFIKRRGRFNGVWRVLVNKEVV